MKAFVLAGFLGIAHAFSKNIVLHKRYSASKKLDGSLDPPDASINLLGEEQILALILGKDAISDKCQQNLEKYCKNLGGIGLEPKDLHPALEEFCQKAKQKCTDLKTKITNVSGNARSFLLYLSSSLTSAEFTLNKVQCNYVHVQYTIFREFASFRSLCDNLDEQCHEAILETLTYEALSRALVRNLETEEACNAKIPDFCPVLETVVRGKISCIPPPPHTHLFDPLKFPPTLQEKIGLDRLFTEAEAVGLLNIKLSFPEIRHFLLLAYHNTNPSNDKIARCTYYLGNCTFRHLKELGGLCNKTNHTEVCEQINNTVKGECDSFRLTLQQKGLFKLKNGAKNMFYTSDRLSEMIHEKVYADLISKCYYLQSHCGADFLDACGTLKAAYSRAQLFNLAKEVLLEELFGFLHDWTSDGVKKCAVKLVERCQKVRNDSIDLLSMCLKPGETCEELMWDLGRRSSQLYSILGKKRDYPEEKDCVILEKECENLSKDFEEFNAPCSTLRRNCAHLRNAQKLKDALLSKNSDVLVTVDNCAKYLETKCPRWFMREMSPFSLICIAHYKTCLRIRGDVQNHCSALEQNMKIENVVKQSEDDKERDNICFLWEEYCDMLMGNCPDKLKQDNNGDGLCVKLKGNCKTFRDKFPLLKALMYNIKGSLTDKDVCTTRLKDYCASSIESNKTLEDSCKEYNEDDTRDKICVKFVKWMEILCNNLPTKLNKVAKDLEDRVAEFEETKEQAEKATSDSGLFLVASQAADEKQNHRLAARGNVTAYIRLVRRDDLDIESSVRHGLAFDLMSLVLELYLEAKDICDHFIEECAFEDDCLNFKNPCQEIREHCKAFVLPKAVSPTETSVLTVTVTDSTTMTDDKPKPTVTMKDGICVVIDSKTTWVTSKSVSRKTKTHTSVTTSTQKCKPVPCTTEDARTKEPETGGADTEVPSGATKISGLTVMNIVIWRRAQAAQNDGIDEEHIFALILKGDYNDDTKCKKKLKEYCENLKGIDENFRIYSKLKETCKEDKKQEEKCTELKNKVKTKCTAFETELGKVEKDASKLTHDDCKKNEQQCLFLEGACPKELTEKCNELRNKCYQKKRDGVAEEVLLRAVRGSIESDDDCKKKLKEVCLELSQESNELTKLCLDQETTCKKFVAGKQEKCTDLEKTVKEALTKKDGLRGKCLSLLEQCYFHRGNCQGDKSKCKEPSNKDCKEYIPDCDKLAEECQKQNIAYIPPGPPFDPTRPAASLAEDIGLEKLYRDAEEDGVVIGEQRVRDATALLALLLGNNHDENKCEQTLKEQCKDPHKHEALENLCKGNDLSEDGKDKCKELKDDVKKICDNLKPTILKNNLYDEKNIHNGIIGWEQLPTFLSSEECAKLESYCFYFEKKCQDGEKACMNVRAACYKRGLDARANNVLQEKMRGWLHGSNETWRKEFQKKLVEVCGELKGNKGTFPYDELFVLCVQPLRALRLLTHDHQMRTVFLREQLDKKRDFPGDKDCKELGRKCEELRYDSREIWWPCYTLEQQCERLGTTELLKTLLLSEQKDTLKDHAGCEKYLKEKCNLWTRRGDGRFSLVCAFQNATCKLMVDDVQSRCNVFEKNLKASNISHEFNENNPRMGSLEMLCPSWHSYCSKFGPNCPNLKKDGAFCTKLEKHCKPFYKRKALEDALKVEFRGKLSDENKCIPALQSYCTILENVKNASISNLCKANTKDNGQKDDNQVRKELCQKLVAEVKQQCAILPEGLKQPAEDLKKDLEIFNELKKQAEKAMKEAKLVLSVAKTGGDNTESGGKKDTAASRAKDTMKHVKVVRRGTKDVPVTELEARALDLAADVLARYVELRERCTRLNSDCGIRKDCQGIEEVCKNIDKTCGGLKPLDIRSQEIVTKNVTTTTTKTVGPGGETVEECKSVKTTDTWVTKTSTHTSTSTSTSTTTSTVTLTSTRRCKPTRCTTGDEAGDVTPSGGLKMAGWSVVKGVLFVSHFVGHNLARGVARAVKRRAAGGQNVYEDEEILLAFILKKDDLEDQKCKVKLKAYCGELRNIDKDFSIYSELKEICKDDGVTKCTNLKTSVDKKYNSFKTDLGEVAKKQIPELTDEHCSNQEKCLFLENAYPDLKENCNTLRTNCYQKKREEVADEALLRALSGHLENDGKCKERLKVICPELGQESDELTRKCINLESTCTSLLKATKEKCEFLKTEVEKALKTDGELQKKGQSLLKDCHFYGPGCKDSKCDELKDKCKKKEIVYLPPGSHFDPTRPEPTLAEKIGLEELYKEAAADGVLIERALEIDILDLLVLLSGTTAFTQNQCKTILTDKCESFKHLAKNLEELCKNKTEHANKCQKYEQEFQGKKDVLTTRFKSRKFESKIVLWTELPKYFGKYDCTELQSDCFYFESQSFETPCKNVKAMCYKRGLDSLANEALQDKLRGKFDDEIRRPPEELHKELVKACKDLKNKSKELFTLCMEPTEAVFTISTDLHIKTDLLQEHLDAKRDLPTRQHCTDLLKKCADLGQDSREIEWPCRTLRHHCARLGVAEQLEEKLLAEKVEKLDDFESCVETLRGRCSGWGRRGRTRYALGCVAPNATCTYLTGSVESKCATLKARMEKSKVVDEAKKKEDKEKDEICERWMPFCGKFMSSCGDLTSDEDKYCKGLEKECGSFIKRQELEKKALNELKGSLKTDKECKETLDKYCTQLTNATNGLETLCTDKSDKKTKSDDDVRKELCEKLIQQVKNQCPALQKKLTEAKKELEEKAGEYENIKNKAQDALKKANLVLVTTRATNGSGNKAAAPAAKSEKQFKLVRRDAKTSVVAKVTEEEITAFDLVSQALSLYVELKEECQDLLKDCGFKVECPQCEDACKTIENKCNGLKPLEVTEHKVETSTTTTTTTTTTTIVGSEAGKAGTEQCTSIKTTDTWVTHTSTHTSTSTSTSTTTSTVTLTSTRRCKPTRCTTGDEAGEVTPSGGLRMSGWGVKGVLLGMMISVMI
ncbi:hypothetical protein PMAC_000659 [Pneumocystis sp. 'macacae']|nr:hypothetical protein PMAC_000659 [Pneumocystis sp. 'macacae']